MRRIEVASVRGHAVYLMAAFASCGGNSGLTAQNVSGMVTQAICTSEKRCCANPSSNYLSQCELDSSIVFNSATQSSGSFTTYNQDTANECLEAAQGYNCDSSLAEIDEMCQMVFTGNVALGGACELDAQCAQPAGGHALCVNGIGGTVCVQESLYGREGAPCDYVVGGGSPFASGAHSFVCAFYEGYFCERTTASDAGTCTKAAGLGATCNQAYVDCASGTYCDSSGTMMCQAREKAGDPCDSTTTSAPCGNGLSCINGACGQTSCG